MDGAERRPYPSKKLKMNDNKIIHRPVFGVRGFAIAEFTPKEYGLIGLADCLHVELINITCFSCFAPTSYIKRHLKENGLDDALINISTYRKSQLDGGIIQSPVNSRLVERVPTVAEGANYCPLLCRDAMPDAILIFKYWPNGVIHLNKRHGEQLDLLFYLIPSHQGKLGQTSVVVMV